jgi:hypothetical protein
MSQNSRKFLGTSRSVEMGVLLGAAYFELLISSRCRLRRQKTVVNTPLAQMPSKLPK